MNMGTTFIVMFLAAIAFGCGGGGDGEPDVIQDQGVDEQTPEVTQDQQEEETPAAPARVCAAACAAPADCCLSAPSCGSYPDKWTCGAYCEIAGCLDDTECQNWATGRGFPNPAGYGCRTRAGGLARCVAGCTAPAECCPSGVDCTGYPNRVICDGGNCFIDGCLDDIECQAYATAQSLPDPDLYVCRPAGQWGLSMCIRTCTAAADCCLPGQEPCDALPHHYACPDGLCSSTCAADAECQSYAASLGIPNAASYKCF